MLCFTPTKGKLKILHYANSFQKSFCKQGLVWDHDLTYLTHHFFCEAAKICKLPRNKRNHPICTCVLQTWLNDTVWDHKSLQVLISGNLCLKVKHFSSSGPILVTAQLLSVIHSLPPALCRETTANPECQVPIGRTQDVQSSIPLTWWGTEGITKSAATPAHCRVFEKQAE